MNRLTLVFRNLRYFRGVNLAVVAGMAVATAVLTGALMVGDSVRGSLADLALRRLGGVDQILVSTRFFDQSLASRINGDKPDDSTGIVTPAIIVRGGAASEQGDSHTADVQIAAIGAAPFDLPSIGGEGFPVRQGTCSINGELASGLGQQKTGGPIVLSVPAQSDMPRESALSRRSRNDVLNQMRATVGRIDSQPDFVSLFDPNASQRVPRNAWANLNDLQGALEQEGRINALLVHGGSAREDAGKTTDAHNPLNARLGSALQLSDYGLSVQPVADGEACVFARETYIAPPVVDAAQRTADALHVRLRKVSVNLINSVANLSSVSAGAADQSPMIHYAVAAGITALDDSALAENEIAVNQWTAGQLKAKVGDKLRIDFYLRQSGGDLTDAGKALPADRLTFIVKTILPMTGIGADPKLPPNYKGLTDAASVADWDPPEGLTIDKKLVTKADEEYWRQYRAAPKLFFNFQTARKLWGGVYGDVTGLRFPAADADKFATKLRAEINPASLGFSFRPIKAQQLAAASGGTDFSMFFLMFSFFLIVAAALLVAMLFRLNIEQRARQFGLMSAVGFSPRSLRMLALREGLILAVVGGAIGLGGAIAYTDFIMLGLRTWWIGAVGTTSMTLHVVPLTLIYGLFAGLFVAFFAIIWAVWRIGKSQPARLLAGGWETDSRGRGKGRMLRWIAAPAVVIGLAIVGAALSRKISTAAGFGGGALLLCGCLTWLAATLRPRPHAGASFVGGASVVRLGFRNATRHTARGVLSVGLIAFAAFTLITVAALKQNGVLNPDDRNSEAGGYRLVLSAGIPLTGDLNTVEGRRLLGIRDPNDPIYAGVHFTPLRQWAGQDISCLNLTKPTAPTILGLPAAMIQRGGFIPGDAISNTGNFWTLLDSDQGDEIPVIADSDTQEYVLKIELGGAISITDQLGVTRNLKLVATVAHSIFQGQLLMSDGNFRKLFPAQSGFGVALIDLGDVAPGERADRQSQLARRLGSELQDFSVSVDTASARLKAYQDVQNTYLETFQTLGALGMMLGAIGLSVVLVRTVIERRGELALLAALGFTAASRTTLVLAENIYLLLLGLILGTLSAVIGILPAVVRETRPINAGSLVLTLSIVLIVGLISAAAAVRLSGIHVKPADLRNE
ncbi:MAG TPA: ABC transporter permease [Tepidisphaeraceae bacterium]|nr:ABC transporter permease [Tepidisphaeraceae bacterium]